MGVVVGTPRLDIARVKRMVEEQVGFSISWQELAERIGVDYTTLWRQGESPTRVEYNTLVKLRAFIQDRGLDITLDDLIVEE